PQNETIQKIAILFRSGNGAKVQRNVDGSDMYIPIVSDPAQLQVRLKDPMREPLFNPQIAGLCLNVGASFNIEAKSSITSDLKIFYNGTQLNALTGTTITANPTISSAGLQRIVAEAKIAGQGPVHRFTGNGSWNTASNWQGNAVPPAVIPAGTEVIIEPSPGGQCVLDVTSTQVSFAAGSKLTVADNAHFIINGNFSWPSVSAFEDGSITVRDTIEFFVAAPTPIAALPNGVEPNGVTYHNGGTSATLVLYAPNKNNIVLVGDFNDWTPGLTYQMSRTPDNLRYWVTISGLTPGQEYAYQYIIDCNLKVADYNTEKILDPWNDPQIPAQTYPGLKPYPTGKTTDIVSVLQPGKPVYNWTNNNFVRPDKRNMIAYELLIRDFAAPSNFQTIINNLPDLASLGINTLKLMPITEFENNNSWGYNPSFMFAVDKYYGTENKLRELIDSCHGRGIAVVLDMVLNHQFGQSPMVRMYWDAALGKPAANSPWFNPDAKHPFNVGYDMNHEAPATAEFVENVMKHWLTKFRFDGFRWDLSKGFTQRNTPDNVGAWNAYDQSRVNIWQRIYNQSQAIEPGCYMILEHLGNDDEEAELAKMGMLLWGKMTNEFNEASMGWLTNSNFQRAYHTTRWTAFNGNNVPHLVAYAESHDEERLFYRNRRFGNANSQGVPPYFHNATTVPDAAIRMQSVAAFLFTIPGPKMLWQHGEFGYDASINMCENYTTPAGDGCRLSPKPPITAMPVPYYSATVPGGGFTFSNYKTVPARNALRDMYAKILRLRTRSDPEFLSTFVTNNVNFSLGGAFKWQIIQSENLRMVVIGNFDVIQQSGTVTFPTTGTWQVYAHNIYGNALNNLSGINAGLTATTLTVNTNTQTFNNLSPGSFIILLDRQATIAANMQSFNAGFAAGTVQLDWQMGDEVNMAGYEVERSFDGLNYEVIGVQQARSVMGATAAYTFADADKNVVYGDKKVWYRIRMNDRNGDHQYGPTQIIDPMPKWAGIFK
ncbi:MAG TPA: alpha-amylase family glycosyl hydrolase, partial [Phnomibacter sp.]|nr:alpha-amylase family glycosyl hydrolase [Phnomibacter sp.]